MNKLEENQGDDEDDFDLSYDIPEDLNQLSSLRLALLAWHVVNENELLVALAETILASSSRASPNSIGCVKFINQPQATELHRIDLRFQA